MTFYRIATHTIDTNGLITDCRDVNGLTAAQAECALDMFADLGPDLPTIDRYRSAKRGQAGDLRRAKLTLPSGHIVEIFAIDPAEHGDSLNGVSLAAAHVARVRETLAEAEDARDAMIRLASEGSDRRTEIATAAGVSRERLYQILAGR